jgi:transposase InsO family protein
MYYEAEARQADPAILPERARRDAEPCRKIRRVHEADFGVEPSVGSAGGSSDNALAETIIGRCETEVIHHRGPWRTKEAAGYATLEWVDWFDHRRLLETIGNVPPAESAMPYFRQRNESAEPA